MRTPIVLSLLTAAIVAVPLAARAESARVRLAETAASGTSTPEQPHYVGPGGTINDAKNRAQREPGVANELNPDSKQSATGGPVGGAPGQPSQ